jgi:hypothetical protein
MATLQVGVPPLQLPPLQLLNVDPAAADAVNVTSVFVAKSASQLGAHEMPLGALLTVPVPGPAISTCK